MEEGPRLAGEKARKIKERGGRARLILLVCLYFNYLELRRPVVAARAATGRPDYWLDYYLLRIINYRELAGELARVRLRGVTRA